MSNAGQSAFSSGRGIPANPGSDLNIPDNPQLTGHRVKVAVVDTGLEICHPDLADNVEQGASWNFRYGTSRQQSNDHPRDPYPLGNGFDHGTAVAGLIASVSANQIGGTGVAPRAFLRGYNFLGTQTLANELAALGMSRSSPKSDDVRIFNMSYGYPFLVIYQNKELENHIRFKHPATKSRFGGNLCKGRWKLVLI